MRTRSSLLASVAAAALVVACGTKRPPAVVTGGGTPPPEATRAGPLPAATPDTGLPIDTGPDVQPMRDEGAAGSELTGISGQDGPLVDIFFGYNVAALDEEATAILKGHAQWLRQHPDARITIEGHCDQRGTVEYNLALGDQRAQSARDYLASLGISQERIQAVSFGKERPVDPGMSEAAWAKNRRAHFVLAR